MLTRIILPTVIVFFALGCGGSDGDPPNTSNDGTSATDSGAQVGDSGNNNRSNTGGTVEEICALKCGKEGAVCGADHEADCLATCPSQPQPVQYAPCGDCFDMISQADFSNVSCEDHTMEGVEYSDEAALALLKCNVCAFGGDPETPFVQSMWQTCLDQRDSAAQSGTCTGDPDLMLCAVAVVQVAVSQDEDCQNHATACTECQAESGMQCGPQDVMVPADGLGCSDLCIPYYQCMEDLGPPGG